MKRSRLGMVRKWRPHFAESGTPVAPVTGDW
jgi:hypothetical protein